MNDLNSSYCQSRWGPGPSSLSHVGSLPKTTIGGGLPILTIPAIFGTVQPCFYKGLIQILAALCVMHKVRNARSVEPSLVSRLQAAALLVMAALWDHPVLLRAYNSLSILGRQVGGGCNIPVYHLACHEGDRMLNWQTLDSYVRDF